MKIEDLHFELPTETVDEGNWELEKWRKEHPMDYFKALHILNMSDDSTVKAEVFKTIYRITRMHIPDVLYKYYSLSDNETSNMKKFQTLSDGQIYMSDIKDFNDPFDGQGFFYDATQLADIERLKPHGGRFIDSFNAYIKAASLTSNGIQSMPMWAHYSNNHAGFCVSYDMKANIGLSSCTFPVQYTDIRLDVTSLMKTQAQKTADTIDRQTTSGNKEIILDDLTIVFMACLLCNLKHTSWSYEQEFRCTTGAIAAGMPYIEARPKEIFIGMNCAPRHAERLIKIAASWKIPVYRMEFDERSEQYALTARNMNDSV
ncbi:DUF2971 domain-containing protein [Clostridiaceae bacterium NSJ-31]|uniref:DUF2971 domain-containing protein n=1 Tax=Ligaoa zhengdingensis TaxID=2763658 RepID=A0A926E153_9FIRM|nr:DUF2971 domain-containing protein [Ligaoa zhengdingensis]MBC8547723.1 DUF2971 domain-containing protein [Ligaoa zhengdingensis]